MSKKDKKPKHNFKVDSDKTPKRNKNPEGYLHLPVAWHFQYMDTEGPWPCSLGVIQGILNSLHEYERKTWSMALEGESNHPMPVEKICKKARERLSGKLKYDPGNLYQFKIAGNQGKQRLWGMKRENVFQILWWDPEHTVYPTSKKHT